MTGIYVKEKVMSRFSVACSGSAGMLLAALTVLMPSPAKAWDGIKSGKISGVDVVADGQNFGYRVYLDGTPMCGTSEGWAYINRNASNYDAMVALLTAAYLNGRNVIIHTQARGVYCEIGYVMFRS